MLTMEMWQPANYFIVDSPTIVNDEQLLDPAYSPGLCILENTYLGQFDGTNVFPMEIVPCEIKTSADGSQILTINPITSEQSSLTFIKIKNQDKMVVTIHSADRRIGINSACPGSTDIFSNLIARSLSGLITETGGMTNSPESTGACYDASNSEKPVPLHVIGPGTFANVSLALDNSRQAIFNTVTIDGVTKIVMGDQTVTPEEIYLALQRQSEIISNTAPEDINFLILTGSLDLTQLESQIKFFLPTSTPQSPSSFFDLPSTPNTPVPQEQILQSENLTTNSIGMNITQLPPDTILYIQNPQNYMGNEVRSLRDLSEHLVPRKTINEQLARAIATKGGVFGFNKKPGEMIRVTDVSKTQISLAKVMRIYYTESGWGGLTPASLNIIGESATGELIFLDIPMNGKFEKADTSSFVLKKTTNKVDTTLLKMTINPRDKNGLDSETMTFLMRSLESITHISKSTEPTIYTSPSRFIPSVITATKTSEIESKLYIVRTNAPTTSVMLITNESSNTTKPFELPTGTKGKLIEIVCSGQECWAKVAFNKLDLPVFIVDLDTYFYAWIRVDDMVADTHTDSIIRNTPTPTKTEYSPYQNQLYPEGSDNYPKKLTPESPYFPTPQSSNPFFDISREHGEMARIQAKLHHS